VPSEYATIQAGIDAAAFGDSVLVAPGVYKDYEVRDFLASCAFLKDGVCVKSEAGPASTTIDIINMQGPLGGSAVIANALPSGVTSFEGFTIEGREKGGGALIGLCEDMTLRDCVFQNFDGGPTAGGAVVIVGNGSIIDSKFTNCRADLGGAIYCTDGHIDLIGCLIQSCQNTPVQIEESGGGAVSTTIMNCQFLDNTSSGGAGGLALGLTSGPTIIKGCLFKGNINTGSGGGAVIMGLGQKTVQDCVFIENGAMGSNGQGGGLSAFSSPLIVHNNTFFGNYKTTNIAGGSAAYFAPPTSGAFESNIVSGSHGGPAVENLGTMSTNCNVFWDNAQGIGVPLAPTDRVVDPLLCDPAIYDLTLRTGSPCLPNDPLGCGLIGALGQGCGAVSVESKSWGKIKGLYR